MNKLRIAIKVIMASFPAKAWEKGRSFHFADEAYWDIPLKSRNIMVRALLKGVKK